VRSGELALETKRTLKSTAGQARASSTAAAATNPRNMQQQARNNHRNSQCIPLVPNIASSVVPRSLASLCQRRAVVVKHRRQWHQDVELPAEGRPRLTVPSPARLPTTPNGHFLEQAKELCIIILRERERRVRAPIQITHPHPHTRNTQESCWLSLECLALMSLTSVRASTCDCAI
jgi:hypothetical protein